MDFVHKVEIKFHADKAANEIVCEREGTSTLRYKRYGIHPALEYLTKENVEDWNNVVKELGW
jgi:hypothetical protein